nr:hypothetical protein [Tanacetum cinerariifolium]
MTSLFAESHNMVAILEKSDAAEGFKQIIDFLSGSYINNALTTNIADLSKHTTRYISPVLTQKDFANMRRVEKGFSGVETPLFEGMLVVRDVAEDVEAQVPAQGDDVQEPATEEVATDVVSPTPTSPSPSSPVIPSSPSHQPPCLPQPQDAEGASLLFQRVLDTCSTLALRGRMIADMDHDEGIELVIDQEKDADVEGRHADKQAEIYNIYLDHSLKVLSMQEDDTDVQEAVEVVTTAKLMTEVVTAAATQVVAASTPILAAKLKTLTITAAPALREEIEKEDEEFIKSINETPAQKAAKRRKLSEEAQEADDLRKSLEIIQDEDDDVFVEATPLAQKDAIWRNQKNVHGLALVKRWKLLTSCGVHVITLLTVQLFLLVEKRLKLKLFKDAAAVAHAKVKDPLSKGPPQVVSEPFGEILLKKNTFLQEVILNGDSPVPTRLVEGVA